MSCKLHFLNSHMDYFPENLGAVSEEQGGGFTKISRKWREGIKVDGIQI